MATGKANRRSISRAESPQGRTRKAKRTFSLSVDSVDYLEHLAGRYRSVSEALDALIREKQAEAERARVSAGIRGYYDSISEEVRAENLAWGELVASHLTRQE
jgi:hypothetical protein